MKALFLLFPKFKTVETLGLVWRNISLESQVSANILKDLSSSPKLDFKESNEFAVVLELVLRAPVDRHNLCSSSSRLTLEDETSNEANNPEFLSTSFKELK